MIHPQNGSVEDIVAYNGVRIEGSVKRSILFPGVYIAPGAEVEDSVLFFDTQIGTGVKICKTITDIGVTVGKNCVVGDSQGDITVIGMHAQIHQETVIKAGSSINPA
jgi:glucose-1-phosphate adenylyltransferase